MAIVFGAVGIILAVTAALLGFFAVRAYRRASRLGTPLSRARKVRPGLRKVKGRVAAAGELLKSPVGNQPCVYYRMQVCEERRQWKASRGAAAPNPGGVAAAGLLGGALGVLLFRAFAPAEDDGNTRSVRSWETVLEEVRGTALVIEDDTGRVEVDLTDAEVVTKDPARLHADLSRPAPVRLSDMLAKKHRIFTVDDRGRVKTMMVVEETLREGARVTALGTVEADDDGTPFFQAGEGAPLLVSEADLGKQARSARGWGTGLAAAAGGTLALGAVLLALAVVAQMRAR